MFYHGEVARVQMKAGEAGRHRRGGCALVLVPRDCRHIYIYIYISLQLALYHQL